MQATADHTAYFAARARSAALPPAMESQVARDLEARLARTTDPTIRACISKLIESARRGPYIPRPSRLPDLAPSRHGVEGDYRGATS
ncbi:hypothetical protein [Sandaracinus amylolyticus]|uniref:hypothetical protein n=1 Tax=Sandaracinus amylolyticus TaxID=927083 RepID=UPI001F334E13|nr:hypothetical protein [Sandaracinus amylolyticus]UJR81450.1 Hypothetical protein I5071_35090 [Sandaracinus amylolyticus]